MTDTPKELPNAAHAEAIDILSQQVLIWFKQIREFENGDFPNRHERAAALRKKCHEVELSIKHLEGKEVS